MSVQNDRVGRLIHRIQTFILPRRIRVREFFMDYDPLKSGRCSKLQFVRAIANIGGHLTDEEAAEVAEHFRLTGDRVQKPQDISYVKFCEAVDEVYAIEGTEWVPSPAREETMQRTFEPNALSEDEEVQISDVLHRLASLCKARGVIFRESFIDMTHGTSPSPVALTKRRSGQIAVNQFVRFFPFPKEFSTEELQLLCRRYATANGDIHFYALHQDISECLPGEAPPVPTSTGHSRKNNIEWTHAALTPLQKIQTTAVEKRLRLHEHFQDFDPLRKGRCTYSQVKTVFTILSLDRILSRSDLDILLSTYTKDVEFFDYVSFCKHVEAATTTPHLEKDPLGAAPSDASTVLAMRKNKMQMSGDQRDKLQKLEDWIRSRVRHRGVLLKPVFTAMDKRNWGHLTVTQFARCLSMLGMGMDEESLDLLCHEYCDLGTQQDINYVDFCKSCDPPSGEVEMANQQLSGPYMGFVPSKYFDDTGVPVPATGRMSPLII